MKKWLLLLVGMLLLAGCGTANKGLTKEEAANTLIEALVYQKETDTFKKNFEEADEFLKLLDREDTSKFTNEIVAKLAQGGQVQEQESQELVKAMNTAVKEKTSYKVKDIEKNTKKDDEYNVTYEVYGVNFLDCFKQSLGKMVEQVKTDAELAGNREKFAQFFVVQLTEALNTTEKIKEPIEVKITLIDLGKNWQVATQRENDFKTLFFALYLGSKDETTFIQDIMVVANQIAKQNG